MSGTKAPISYPFLSVGWIGDPRRVSGCAGIEVRNVGRCAVPLSQVSWRENPKKKKKKMVPAV